MTMKWVAAVMLMLAVAVSTFELKCVASERTGPSPAASAGPYGEAPEPDLPSAFELDDREAASIPVLTH
jgi:hypothetical protein